MVLVRNTKIWESNLLFDNLDHVTPLLKGLAGLQITFQIQSRFFTNTKELYFNLAAHISPTSLCSTIPLEQHIQIDELPFQVLLHTKLSSISENTWIASFPTRLYFCFLFVCLFRFALLIHSCLSFNSQDKCCLLK